jgi:hypothetical protein
VLVPDPVVSPPGILVSVHDPEGRLFTTIEPVPTRHVGCVIVPAVGADGMAFTVRAYVASASVHGEPSGLFDLTVMVITFPASAATGV